MLRNQKYAALVYQAGIANVFELQDGHDVLSFAKRVGAKRILQADFRTCENFARGLDHAGYCVYSLHCNKAGDIALQDWGANLDEAPFRESFHPVGSYQAIDQA